MKEALCKQVAAVGRPVCGRVIIISFLEDRGAAGAAGWFCDEVEAILGQANANREPRTVGGPNRFRGDRSVERDAGLVRAQDIENPQVRAGITRGDQKPPTVTRETWSKEGALIANKT